jgi:exonuclease VII small subunit
MTFIVSPHFIEVLENQDVDLEMPKKIFFEGLEKVGKTFF